MKQTIKLTESKLRDMINEAVKGAILPNPSKKRKSVSKKLTESRLRNMIQDSVKRAINEKIRKEYFVADEGDGTLNPFSIDMFDNEGYLEGHKGERGYHINDFDIIRYFNSWEQACDYCDKYCS